jgi:hypothetical protein
MPSDYDRIARENIKRYGTDIGQYGPVLLANLYSDRTHFVYELLQNAEDAEATEVEFRLFKDRLEVCHNGRPFNEADVRGICGLVTGTKADDLTQIGRFGIGFKSVFAYTNAPRVYSVDEAFSIKDYVHPFAISPVSLAERETLFVFPFDHQDVPKHAAFDEMAARLHTLGLRTLLFLTHIGQISWTVEGGMSGDYIRETEEISERIRRVYILAKVIDEEEEEEWLVSRRVVDTAELATVVGLEAELATEVAFQVGVASQDGKPQFIPAVNSRLVAFFSTDKETHLKFLVQGPYRTTPARDNIPSYDEWNKKLIHETAILVADSITQAKEMGFLAVDFLNLLPISPEEFPENFMFRPLFDEVCRRLQSEEELLPTENGGYTNAQRALLARGRDLAELLSEEQLVLLLGKQGQWLDTGITRDRTPILRSYLMSEIGISEVDPERFARQFNEAFIEAQSDEWVVKFYTFLSGQMALLRTPKFAYVGGKKVTTREAGLLYTKPIIRLADHTHVAPFTEDDKPNAYLPGDFASSPKTVKKSIADVEDARRFLTSLGFSSFDVYAEVVEQILPKYKQDPISVGDEEGLEDSRKIAQALANATVGERTNLMIEIKIRGVPILVGHKGSTEEDISYHQPTDLYLPSTYTTKQELEEFLRHIGVFEDIFWLDKRYVGIYDAGVLMEMGCVGKLDRKREVERHILPKYQKKDEICVSADENVRDVEAIVSAIKAIPLVRDQKQFIDDLGKYSILSATNADTGKKAWWIPRYVHLGTQYTGDTELQTYFARNGVIDFLDSVYVDVVSPEDLAQLGCASEIRITRKAPSSSGHVDIRDWHGSHERGLDGFDPDFEIEGLEHALSELEKSSSVALAQTIWNLAKRHPESIHGTVESCTRQNFTGKTTKRERASKAGKLLREHAWLPDRNGVLHISSEVRLSELPGSFDTGSLAAKELARRLGCASEADLSQFSQSERERISFALELDNDEIEMIKEKRRKERSEAVGVDEETESLVSVTEAIRDKFNRPGADRVDHAWIHTTPVFDPERRRMRTQQEIAEAIASEPAKWQRFDRVPTKKWESKDYDTRTFLKEEYHGECQICGYAFHKRNGEAYFEGLYLVSRTKAAWIDRPGNVLCLCANCCAKLLYGEVETEGDIVEQLASVRAYHEGGKSKAAIRFKLCSEDVALTFHERHIIDLQEMLKVEEVLSTDQEGAVSASIESNDSP